MLAAQLSTLLYMPTFTVRHKIAHFLVISWDIPTTFPVLPLHFPNNFTVLSWYIQIIVHTFAYFWIGAALTHLSDSYSTEQVTLQSPLFF